MTTIGRDTSEYLRLALWFFPAAVVTWGLHESAHWATGELLGYDMWISFNQVGLVEGRYATTFHEVLVAMAGPFMTWVQASVFLILIRRDNRLHLYAFLVLALFMRAVALGISYASQPNDEAAASLLLGLPMWLLPMLSVSVLMVLTYFGSKQLHVGWKGNVLSYVMGSIVVTLVIVLNSIVF